MKRKSFRLVYFHHYHHRPCFLYLCWIYFTSAVYPLDVRRFFAGFFSPVWLFHNFQKPEKKVELVKSFFKKCFCACGPFFPTNKQPLTVYHFLLNFCGKNLFVSLAFFCLFGPFNLKLMKSHPAEERKGKRTFWILQNWNFTMTTVLLLRLISKIRSSFWELNTDGFAFLKFNYIKNFNIREFLC